MTPFSDRMILAWLAGVLDPPLAKRLGGELASDPSLQARVARLRERLAEPAEGPRWRLPPTGLAVGFSADLRAEASMGAGLRPGDLVAVRLSVADDTPRQVVVLAREEAVWRVLSPESPEETLALAELEQDDSGQRVLYLSLAEAPEVQLRAVLLPPLDLPVDWSLAPEERWRALQALLDKGEVPAITLEISLRRRDR